MKKIFWALACVTGLMVTACIANGKKVATVTDMDSLAADSLDKDAKQASQEVSIYKIWINEDSTRIYDLRDTTHYVEAMKYDEEYCKENPDYKPDVYYIYNEAGGFRIGHNFDDEPDTTGWIEYLLEEGPYAGTYAMSFSFSDMTPTSATFTFELEYDWKYTVLDKPVTFQPNPHPYVYEE